MPCCAANAVAFPGVGDVTATTRASGTDFKASTWIDEMNRDPISPTPTVFFMAGKVARIP